MPFDTPRPRRSFGSNTPLNDDASEIRTRRQSLAPSRASISGSLIVSTPRSRPLEVVAPIPRIPDEQDEQQKLVDFEQWLRMAMENKINTKNAWKLSLIDYFHEMTFSQGKEISFQRASCTLEGCVKIYSARVDSIVIEAGKLLSGLANSSVDESDGDEEVDPERRTRKKNHTSTLVKDYKTLTVKKFDLEFSIDPLFKKTCADFDEGGAQGLLLNHLPVDADGKIIFDASDAMPDKHDDENDNDGMDVEDSEQKIDISKLRSKFLPELKQIFNKEICPSLKGFDFSRNNNLDFRYASSDAGDAGDAGDTGGEDCLDCPDYPDYPDTFDNENDILDDNLVTNDDILGVFDEDDINPRERLTENDFVMAMVNNENELFSYFDSAFLRNWAGPEHWKIKRANKRNEPTETGETRERKKKEPVYIDFINSEDVDERIIFASGGNITNPKLAEEVSYGLRLPEDMKFSSKKLLQLFFKPQFMLKSKRRYEAQFDDNDNVEIDENFWANQTNDPTETSFPDMMTTYTGGDNYDDGYDNELEEGEFGDNLVTKAKRNKPNFVKYTRTAKRIDVKKLKKHLMTLMESHESRELKFSEVVRNLKKFYPPKKMKDISVAYCFICLLHLANENNLTLTSFDENSDVHVVKNNYKEYN